MSIQDVIRMLRAALGDTQKKFAQRVGLSMNAIARYESGNRRPTYRSLVLMLRAARAARKAPALDEAITILESELGEEPEVQQETTSQSGAPVAVRPFRQRRLARIEEDLQDLVHDLARTTGQCPNCGAYRADDREEQQALELLLEALAVVQQMQTQAWAGE